MKYDLCIIGGAGHVGLPLGVAFANKHVKTILLDINKEWLEKIKNGEFPFKEENGDRELKKALKGGYLYISENDPKTISQSRFVLIVIGTPIDEYLNSDFSGLMKIIENYYPYFKNGQILILRSTVYPGTSERIQQYFKGKGKNVSIAFCPERIIEGKAFEEFKNFPQIISAFDKKTINLTGKLFKKITNKEVFLNKPIEAELAKLFCNAWRYIQFATANQFFIIAEDQNLDYHKIYRAMTKDYPRMKHLPSPGFAAGPCLFKDTMQLSAFHSNRFFLGYSAMLINEGLPNYIINKLKQIIIEKIISSGVPKNQAQENFKNRIIGILGMAFKADSDDFRDSLSYKLRKVAQAEFKKVICHDVYIKDSSFYSLDKFLKRADIIILATPHKEYRKIKPAKYKNKIFIDVWDFWGE